MFNTTLRRLLEHQRWADERVLDALRAAGSPGRALQLYAHVLGAEDVWLGRLRGDPATLQVWPVLDLEECARHAASLAARYRAYLASIADDDLTREVVYTNSAGDHFTTATGDILMQVAMHGSYHRGQIALLLRQEGREPIPTDYITYVRGASAAGEVTRGGTNP